MTSGPCQKPCNAVHPASAALRYRTKMGLSGRNKPPESRQPSHCHRAPAHKVRQSGAPHGHKHKNVTLAVGFSSREGWLAPNQDSPIKEPDRAAAGRGSRPAQTFLSHTAFGIRLPSANRDPIFTFAYCRAIRSHKPCNSPPPMSWPDGTSSAGGFTQVLLHVGSRPTGRRDTNRGKKGKIGQETKRNEEKSHP